MTEHEQTLAAVGMAMGEALSTMAAAQPSARVHGGCINESYRWKCARGPVFVKVAEGSRLPMLEAEAAGLQELLRADAVRVPRVLAVGAVAGKSFLALEWIDLSASTSAGDAVLGERLARQHRVLGERFGWLRENTIGSTRQINTWTPHWPEFFREHRLRFQLDLARENGFGGRLQERGARLLEHVAEFFNDHRPEPSLLHGDLWGGNAGLDTRGMPVIFDPAVYFGDREADLAMTRLFGGFGRAFYDAYEITWPLRPGARERTDLYNLYHLLNHANLFGGGYAQQAEDTIDRLLATLGR